MKPAPFNIDRLPTNLMPLLRAQKHDRTPHISPRPGLPIGLFVSSRSHSSCPPGVLSRLLSHCEVSMTPGQKVLTSILHAAI